MYRRTPRRYTGLDRGSLADDTPLCAGIDRVLHAGDLEGHSSCNFASTRTKGGCSGQDWDLQEFCACKMRVTGTKSPRQLCTARLPWARSDRIYLLRQDIEQGVQSYSQKREFLFLRSTSHVTLYSESRDCLSSHHVTSFCQVT